MGELRDLSLYADGVQIAEGSRMRLKGRMTMSLRPDLWELNVHQIPDDALAALYDAKKIAVRGQEGSLLAMGQVEEIYTHDEDGKYIATVLIADGTDFWTSTVSVSLAGKNSVLDAVRMLAVRCSCPVPVVHIYAKDMSLFRGQTFHGRTAGYISDLAKSLDARAYFTRGGLYLVTRGVASSEIVLSEDDIIGGVSEADGACFVRLAKMQGYDIGHIVRLPGRAAKYRLLCQTVEADNYQGAWRTELILINEDRIETGDDWGGG